MCSGLTRRPANSDGSDLATSRSRCSWRESSLPQRQSRLRAAEVSLMAEHRADTGTEGNYHIHAVPKYGVSGLLIKQIILMSLNSS